jgi:hypothetical protein
MFSATANDYKDIPDGLITGLAFGWKADSKLKNQVKRWLRKGKWAVTIFQAVPAPDSFSIRFKKVVGRCDR